MILFSKWMRILHGYKINKLRLKKMIKLIQIN